MRTPFTVAAAAVFSLFAPLAVFAAAPGDLIKNPCVGGAPANDPCRAVYFYGGDGKRHAFPNERVYYSWYTNFNAVKTIAPEEMAAIRLGDNVTYRPGIKFVKFLTDNNVYAVAADRTLRWVTSEPVAQSIFGTNWNKNVDDIPDVFYTDYAFGTPITDPGGYSAATEKANAPTIDAAIPDSYKSIKVTTAHGTFDVQVVTLRKSRYQMLTDVASSTVDCSNNCETKPLAQYASEHGALIGIHGSYFCPPDYADCANKTNTFLSPFFDSDTRVMHQSFGLKVHKGPLLASFENGSFRFVRSADTIGSVNNLENTAGSPLVGAASNYPALMQEGVVVVNNEPRLEEGQRNTKATRAGIGMDDTRIFLVVARNATVPDLADIFSVLGARDALNLDGGGSTALLYGGAYKTGPGRTLPNAIIFKAK